MEGDLDRKGCGGFEIMNGKIMTQATVFLRGAPANAVEIRRGMIIKCNEGRAAGRLAGVVVSPNRLQVVCLILSHLPDQEGYQAVPVRWIGCVNEESIFLTVGFEMILALPNWHST